MYNSLTDIVISKFNKLLKPYIFKGVLFAVFTQYAQSQFDLF